MATPTPTPAPAPKASKKKLEERVVAGETKPSLTNEKLPGFVPPENTLFYFTLSSTSAFRAIFDALKELPPSVALSVKPSGLSTINDSEPKNILTIDIPAEDLGDFCVNESVVLGLRTARFSQVIRTVHAKYPVVIFVPRDDPTNLHIRVVSQTPDFSRIIILPLLALQSGAGTLQLPTFQSRCSIPSVRMQKMLKDTMSLGGDQVTIIKTPGFLRMTSAVADYRQEIKNAVVDEVSCPTPLEGRYPASPIKAFIKAITLAPDISVLASQDIPMVLQYNFYTKSSFAIIITDIRG